MKLKYLLILMLLIPLSSALPQMNKIELAARYLKLGNSYREAGEPAIAEKFYLKAKSITEHIKSQSGLYWTAASDEYLAYLYCENGNKSLATSALLSAIEIYDKIIKQPDGSQEAAKLMLKKIDEFDCPCNVRQKLGDVQASDTKELTNDEYNKEDEEPAEPTKTEPKGLSLKTREFRGSGLTQLPTNLPTELENLELSENDFSEIPAGLDKYKKLKFLDLSKNNMTSAFVNPNELKNLEYLNLSNNLIGDLPDEFCKLQNLRVLDLRGNPISSEQIKKIQNCLRNTLIYRDNSQEGEEQDDYHD